MDAWMGGWVWSGSPGGTDVESISSQPETLTSSYFFREPPAPLSVGEGPRYKVKTHYIFLGSLAVGNWATSAQVAWVLCGPYPPYFREFGSPPPCLFVGVAPVRSKRFFVFTIDQGWD